jgi:hypothetical protein
MLRAAAVNKTGMETEILDVSMEIILWVLTPVFLYFRHNKEH